jgi:SOS-response transcriptional repressor LexA
MIQGGKRRVFAMGRAIPVRTDYTASEVRRLAKHAKDAAQARRSTTAATEAPDRYTLIVQGDCMAPVHLDGAAVVVDKRAAYGSGDMVVIYIKPAARRRIRTAGFAIN